MAQSAELVSPEYRFATSQDLANLIRYRLAAHAEVMIGIAKLQFFKENIAKLTIKILSGVNQDVFA
jgi:hypothetical protein